MRHFASSDAQQTKSVSRIIIRLPKISCSCCFFGLHLLSRPRIRFYNLSALPTMESELEGNVRHALQRQSQLMHLCDQECEASVSRTNASISQAVSLLQSRGGELVAATRSCYSQAKTFHTDLHARAAAVLAQLHSQPVQSHTRSQFVADAGARLLKILDDARAAPLCVGCGGSSVSVDLSNVMKAISDLQVDASTAFSTNYLQFRRVYSFISRPILLQQVIPCRSWRK